MYTLSRFGESDIKTILKEVYNCLQKELRGENGFFFFIYSTFLLCYLSLTMPSFYHNCKKYFVFCCKNNKLYSSVFLTRPLMVPKM